MESFFGGENREWKWRKDNRSKIKKPAFYRRNQKFFLHIEPRSQNLGISWKLNCFCVPFSAYDVKTSSRLFICDNKLDMYTA